ncbi:BREX-1 system adenine-specific DNA-methyltransferase PglX [Sphingobacteriales bacterium UPWRP_1]|nr:hypothetical protein BVG80_10180 [Sphingobacteriales bacterium TSM_CSM]PSJ73783.1 BREX-1 system adenine-specific DNA-methyltransferase PglX [Sphingobacteriales bacterium UPWRP_1]
MNTSALKSFARTARTLFITGVQQQLSYWGFTPNGNTTHQPKPIDGGYIFREQVFTNPLLPPQWQELNKNIHNPQSFTDTAEQGAYLWFNLLMSILILEKNHYIAPVLQFEPHTTTPAILQNARRGLYQLPNPANQNLLLQLLTDNQNDEALALLLNHFCQNQPLLKHVFGNLPAYTHMLLPKNLLAKNGILQHLNQPDAISPADYQQVELIGWLYQFYIADRKDEVFAGFKQGKKARPEDIPAATQIFTPRWIVEYMVQNTLGKLWLQHNPHAQLRQHLPYLVDDPNPTHPAQNPTTQHPTTAPTLFEPNPTPPPAPALQLTQPQQLTLLDPACGSGHILVVAFELLMLIYTQEGYTKKQAAQLILQYNLTGIDIDERATQLARLALLLKAAQYYPDVLKNPAAATQNPQHLPPYPTQLPPIAGVFALPQPYLIDPQILHTFLQTDGQPFYTQLNHALQTLHTYAIHAGSALIINLTPPAHAFIHRRLCQMQHQLTQNQLSFMETEALLILQNRLTILLALSQQYPAVVANPPYMGASNMNDTLKQYTQLHYPNAKADLMTIFMEVAERLTCNGGKFAIINLPSWLFLSSFENLRVYFLKQYTIDSLLHMGRGIFGIDFGSVAFTISKSFNPDAKGNYFRLHKRNFQHLYYADIEKLFRYANGNPNYKYDFDLYRDEEGINEIPESGNETGQQLFFPDVPQANFAKIPGSPIAYWVSDRVVECFELSSLSFMGDCRTGLSTSDNNRFLRLWSEIDLTNVCLQANNHNEALQSQKKWFPVQRGGSFRKWHGNNYDLINWGNDGEEVKQYAANLYKSYSRTIKNIPYYFKRGLSWSYITSGETGFRQFPIGYIILNAGPAFYSNDYTDELFVLAYLNSNVASLFLQFLSPTLNVDAGPVSKLPFKKTDNDTKTKIEELTQQNITLSRSDWDMRETSWHFTQNPLVAQGAPTLGQAYEQWQQQAAQAFFTLHAHEEELNRLFIGIYGLEQELSPQVALKDITILQEEINRQQLAATEQTLLEQWRMGGSGAVQLPIDTGTVAHQLLSYAIGCLLGRYRLGHAGLHIAHPHPTAAELQDYPVPVPLSAAGNAQTTHYFTIDPDAILPLMGAYCPFPDDVVRQVRQWLLWVWGEQALTQNLNFLEACLSMSLENYLCQPRHFYKNHVQQYKKKPIYWLFASAPKGNPAFKALVYMHRLDPHTLQRLRNKYLHPHQTYLRQEIDRLKANERSLNKDDLKLLQKFENDLHECRQYDETLKNLANQQITIDLDNGVTHNYHIFKDVLFPL